VGGGKRDVLEVVILMFGMWQEGCLGGGKRDVKRYQIRHDFYGRDTLEGGKSDILEVARATSCRWQERCLVGGKRDVWDMERETLRGINSDVVSMGEKLQDVAIVTVL
jgi:hypothetical protein